MLLSYVKTLALFLFVFVSINNSVVIDYVGEFAIKGAFGFFVVTHLDDLYYALMKPKPLVVKAFFLLILTLIVVTFITYFVKGDAIYMEDLIKLSTMRILAFVVIFLYVTYMDREQFIQFLYIFWFSMVVSAIIAIFSQPVEQYTFRKTGGTEDPNEFAAQLLAAIFTSYYLFKQNRSLIFIGGSLALFLFTLLNAGSKSSFLFLGLLLLMIFLLRFKEFMSFLLTPQGLFSFVLLLGIVGGAFFYVSQTTAAKGLAQRAQQTGTLHERLVVWRAGSEMIRDNFFLGVGFAQFPHVSKGYLKEYIPDEALPSHNNLIKIFAETGVFGFIAFVFFIITLFGSRVGEIVRGDYLWIYLASLSTFLMGLTIPSLHHKDYWFFLSMLSFVIYHLQYGEEEAEEDAFIENASIVDIE